MLSKLPAEPATAEFGDRRPILRAFLGVAVPPRPLTATEMLSKL